MLICSLKISYWPLVVLYFLQLQSEVIAFTQEWGKNLPKISFGSSSPEAKPIVAMSRFIDFADLIDKTPEEQLLVVQFTSRYCKACQRTMTHYKKLDRKESTVQFAVLDCTKMNHISLKKLGVTSFPVVQVWRDGKFVSSFRSIEDYSKNLKNIVKTSKKRSKKEWKMFWEENAAKVTETIEVLEEVKQRELQP
mmetsp:Transcript_12508/g.17476  ORF Transcript_12508/g.17476 Transcript_12508/m.17476 type:complete len:194 (-) Transcript_12508:22-603(-)